MIDRILIPIAMMAPPALFVAAGYHSARSGEREQAGYAFLLAVMVQVSTYIIFKNVLAH